MWALAISSPTRAASLGPAPGACDPGTAASIGQSVNLRLASERPDHLRILPPVSTLPMRQAAIEAFPDFDFVLIGGRSQQVVKIGKPFASHQAMHPLLAFADPRARLS